MTEAQLRALKAFATLPIYDEHDARSDDITRSRTARSVTECVTLEEVMLCLADPGLIPLGGLRARVDGGQVVVAYFARRK